MIGPFNKFVFNQTTTNFVTNREPGCFLVKERLNLPRDSFNAVQSALCGLYLTGTQRQQDVSMMW